MSRLTKPEEFFRAISESPGLKFSFGWLTFLGLVVPTAILITVGVPERYALPALLVLLLPFQYAIFCLLQKRREAAEVRAAEPSTVFEGSWKFEVRAAGHRTVGRCRVKLTTLEGKEAWRVQEIRPGERVIIGRGKECDLVLLADSQISRRQCELLLVEGRVMLHDLDPSSGTMLNGTPIVAREPLESGDIIRLGRTELRITIEPAR